MARNDGRIEPGQKLSTAISARAWNRAQEAADRVLGAGTGATAGDAAGVERASNIVLVRNDTATAVQRFGVLGIGSRGLWTDIASATLEGTDESSVYLRRFSERPILSGRGPTLADFYNLAICLEPIAPQKIGRAAIGGSFMCRVNVTSLLHRFADVKENDTTQLQSAACGPVRLIYTEPGTGLGKWAFGVI